MNYLLAKYMKFHGIKMALSGEGSDEIFGGYLYNHYCPGPDEMHKECVKKIDQLHYYDCLRCHKAFAAFGIEVRVPFLDKALVDYVMAIDPTNKLSSTHPGGPRAEKHILRQCHIAQSADKIQGEQFSYRQKDQFSDACRTASGRPRSPAPAPRGPCEGTPSSRTAPASPRKGRPRTPSAAPST